MDLRADFLVVGSGIASLRAAIEVADAGEVVVLTKVEPTEGNTGYAQGGIAAALGPDDSPELHASDTIRAGDGLCDERAVRVLVEDGPACVRELMDWGVRFDRDTDGTISLAREGAHSVRRVLHARDATGREIESVLWNVVARHRNVRVLTHRPATEAIVEGGRCLGMWYRDERGECGAVTARATLLATGGAAGVFRETTNPAVATGDGIAIGYRAGARVSDLEFVQFHPTVLNLAGAPRFLLTEALRGEGARLVNEAGEVFMSRYDPAGDLAPRDRVARAIVRESERTGGPIYLTLQHLSPSFIHERFPLVSETCRRAGLDLARARIPVGPAAHYVMGGIETDLDGHTSVSGLFAAGEVACTHVHGANRLASNSLLEGLVFGARAGTRMKSWVENVTVRPAPSRTRRPAPEPDVDVGVIRDVMWKLVGLFRDGDGLKRALSVLESAMRNAEMAVADGLLSTSECATKASLATVGCLIARAALRREESRGAHFRSDFPARDDAGWSRHIAESRSNHS